MPTWIKVNLPQTNMTQYLYKRAKMALYRSPDYQISFESIGLSVQVKKDTIYIQYGGHLDQNELLLLYKSPWYFQWSFKSIGLLIQDKKVNIDFQHGCLGNHFGFPIRMILDIFDLQVTLILPIKFWVNWPYCSEEIQNRFSSWLLWWPYWISNLNKFSYFWSTSHPDTSYHVSSKLAFPFRRRSAK